MARHRIVGIAGIVAARPRDPPIVSAFIRFLAIPGSIEWGLPFLTFLQASIGIFLYIVQIYIDKK